MVIAYADWTTFLVGFYNTVITPALAALPPGARESIGIGLKAIFGVFGIPLA